MASELVPARRRFCSPYPLTAMNFRLRYRLSFTERCTWLLLTLLIGLTLRGHAQQSAGAKLSNNPTRSSRRLAATEQEDDDLPARNHGTGIRAGVVWAAARAAVGAHRLPALFEAGAFHQRAFGRAGSVQIEALFFRQRRDSSVAAASGIRLPVLLVFNPFYNISLHCGPQLQWAWGQLAPTEAGARATSAVTAGIVVGGEARVELLRVGLRYGAPMAALTDLKAAGNAAGAAWKGGQVQVYLGMGFGK